MFRSTAGIRSSVQPTACLPISSSMAVMCAETPSTRATVNSVTGGSLSATRSARVPPTGRRRASDSYRTSRARLRALLRADMSGDAAEVFPGPGVHLDLLAGGQEQRDLDLVPGLQLGGLGAAGGAVALQARLGVLEGELDRGRELDVQRAALVHRDDRRLVLQQEVRRVADELRRDVDLLVVAGVHEHVRRAVVV